MRIRVKDVLDLLAAGVPEREILTDYPYLKGTFFYSKKGMKMKIRWLLGVDRCTRPSDRFSRKLHCL